jgi:haloalkane dehalogenase
VVTRVRRDGSKRELARHEARGARVAVKGIETFVLEEGRGASVVLLHGIPASSYLYRKVIPLLAARDLRAIAFDLPGLGLADRPRDFDYSLEGLTRFTGAVIDALGIERCHLVVHDIGGPIGCLWAIRRPERVASLTLLNTTLNLSSYRDPWTLQILKRRGIGRMAFGLMARRIFVEQVLRNGIQDRSALRQEEADVYYDLLRRGDGGGAFLRINRSWCDGRAEAPLRRGLAERPYPAQLVWGENDPVLRVEHRAFVEDVVRPEQAIVLPAKHFLQEDRSAEVASAIATFCHNTPELSAP